jgi:NurA domain
MPYEGEFAHYNPLRRLVETEHVQKLLSRCKVCLPDSSPEHNIEPKQAPPQTISLPRFVVAIDGSNAEVSVVNGYPGAKVGYCTVASVLIDLSRIDELDQNRPVDPKLFRETEKAATIDAALPGSNVVTRRQTSARVSFREELYDLFQNAIVDEEDKVRLIETYEILLSFKPTDEQKCPCLESHGCKGMQRISEGCHDCPTCKQPIFSTDALRIHERFNDLGTNEEVFGYVRQVWERILLIHLLRCFEKRKLLNRVDKIAFFLDGPLAVFGPPAWLSAAISKELKRINVIVRAETGNDLIIIGIEKSGEFVAHFDEIDVTEKAGTKLFRPQNYVLLTDSYIKKRIQQSSTTRRYGQDTYFGRKLFYKTRNGARIVANIPFLTNEQDTIDTDDIAQYPQFANVCALLDRLVSSRFPNAITPIISAHAEASIPLNLGSKVLKQLAQALMGVK